MDSGLDLGRGSGNSSNSMPNNLTTLNEFPTDEGTNEIPIGMVLTHSPAKNRDIEDYAIPPDAVIKLPQSPYLSKLPSMTLPRNRGHSRDTLISSNNSSPMHLPSPAIRASLVPAHENVKNLRRFSFIF